MQGYNVIAVFSPDASECLLCKRKKEPYKNLVNFVGGKIEPGEDGLDSAYRELYEETSIKKQDIQLIHLMDLTYYMENIRLEAYVGRLHQMVEIHGEENDLLWSDLQHNFFDTRIYAGGGSVGHILNQILLYRDQTLR